MRAVVVREHGGVDRLVVEERPTPEPGPREVRIAVRAAGVNHLDTWVRRGVPGHTFPLPLVLGSDASGVVDALGPGARGASIGDEVVVLPGVSCGVCASCQSGADHLCRDYAILGEARDGTCADFIVVPDANVAPKPAGMGFASAAAFGLVFQTAWSMLVDRAQLRPGETVLVHAGGSGVGSAAIQIASLLGARVLATASTDDKCEQAAALGADATIRYDEVDFVGAVKKLTDRGGVDVVFEHVGASTFAGSLKCLKRGGRVVTCGATTGGQVEISLHQVFFKNLSILGNTMGSRGDLLRVLELAAAAKLKPVLGKVLPLTDVAEAHTLLEQRAVFGKIVLEP